jgi:hypothetical protein
MIPWANLDWDNLDFDNFNVSAIEWSTPDWASQSWMDIIGVGGEGGISPGVCTFMSMAVELTEQLGALGSCTCDETNGLEMSCNFTEICAETDADVCGTIQMTLDFDTLSAVNNTVCIDYSEDIHPTTCFSFEIPVAAQNFVPGCNATYGEQGDCKCTIDENFCIVVDCSEFEPTAVTDTCQFVGLGGQAEAKGLMLAFAAPEEEASATDETTGEDAAVDATPDSSEQSSVDGSPASMTQLSVGAGVFALVSSFLLHL